MANTSNAWHTPVKEGIAGLIHIAKACQDHYLVSVPVGADVGANTS